MGTIAELPRLMVAPNGARRNKKDHPKLPLTIAETVEVAKDCYAAGADGIHLHVRDENGEHTLDAGLYRELLNELQVRVPKLVCQITTEAVGIYTPEQQRKLVQELRPHSVSISIAEMHSQGNIQEVEAFYLWCVREAIAVQHILYDTEDLRRLDQLHQNLELQKSSRQILFVLGRYHAKQESSPEDLSPFMNWLNAKDEPFDWAVCAFGKGETKSLTAALKQGGKIRVGFENSLWNEDGSLARDNAERVSIMAKI